MSFPHVFAILYSYSDGVDRVEGISQNLETSQGDGGMLYQPSFTRGFCDRKKHSGNVMFIGQKMNLWLIFKGMGYLSDGRWSYLNREVLAQLTTTWLRNASN